MKRLAVFLAIFAGFTLLTFVGIQLDILMTPWLKNAMENWRWYHYFTSHSLTVLYLTGNWLWLLPALIFSFFLSKRGSFRSWR